MELPRHRKFRIEYERIRGLERFREKAGTITATEREQFAAMQADLLDLDRRFDPREARRKKRALRRIEQAIEQELAKPPSDEEPEPVDFASELALMDLDEVSAFARGSTELWCRSLGSGYQEIRDLAEKIAGDKPADPDAIELKRQRLLRLGLAFDFGDLGVPGDAASGKRRRGDCYRGLVPSHELARRELLRRGLAIVLRPGEKSKPPPSCEDERVFLAVELLKATGLSPTKAAEWVAHARKRSAAAVKQACQRVRKRTLREQSRAVWRESSEFESVSRSPASCQHARPAVIQARNSG